MDEEKKTCMVYEAKMPVGTHYFNRGQKVWLQKRGGAVGAKVFGHFRTRGRYVSAWVKNNPPLVWERVEGDPAFASRYALEVEKAR